MKRHHQLSILALALLQASCGGGGSSGGGGSGTSVSGTVPGTLIEAFGDNGAYYAVESKDNGTNHHPFKLNAPVGVGFELVMTTGVGTPDEVIQPIGFRDSTGAVRTRLMLGKNEKIDLGHIPLYMSKNEAAAEDVDEDGVLDQPMVLDDVGAKNPLTQADADGDNIDDWDDPDHGGYQYDHSTTNPQDVDDDGIPNVYDSDYSRRSDDSDGDGLPDSVDANPYNDPGSHNDGLLDDCDKDGYNDDDMNHDGFHDDDGDRDGYHDDDMDHDGHHDEDGSGTCSSPTTTTTTVPTTTTTVPATKTTTTAPTTTTTTSTTTTTTTTLPPPPPPGKLLYDAACSGCHKAGTYDTSGSFSDLKGKGGKMVNDLSTISGAMSTGNPDGTIDLTSLSNQQVADIAAFLNSL